MNIHCESLNEILRLVEPPKGGKISIIGIVYGFKNGIAFYKDNYRKHIDLIQKMYSSDSKISGNYSFKLFSEYLITAIRNKFLSGKIFTYEDANEINDYFNKLEIQDITVCSEIQGVVTLIDNNVMLGEFKIMPWSKKSEIEELMKTEFSKLFKDETFENLVVLDVKSIDLQKALDKGRNIFSYLENILHVIIGYPSERYNISINEISRSNKIPSLAFSKNGNISWSLRDEGKHYIEPLVIDDEFMNDERFNKLFFLITKEQKTELEKQTLLAAYWLGQAIKENIVIDGYLKATIALEVIFTRSEDGPLPPTTLYKIAESCALILGKDTQNSIDIEREIRDLYSKRSAIVHSGNVDINRKYYLKMCDFSRELIFKLLENNYYGCNTNNDLIEYLKRKKYKN